MKTELEIKKEIRKIKKQIELLEKHNKPKTISIAFLNILGILRLKRRLDTLQWVLETEKPARPTKNKRA